jgi:hypothetical protein
MNISYMNNVATRKQNDKSNVIEMSGHIHAPA